LCSVSIASASMIITDDADFWGNLGGIGDGRGILIQADENFTISSLGIYGDFTGSSYEMDIYSSSGPGDQGALLASSYLSIDGTGGSQHYMFDLDFSFSSNDYYFINFTRTDNEGIMGSVNYYRDWSLPLDYGPFTLLDGTCDFLGTTDWNNSLHCEFAFDVVAAPVPEPATMLLLSCGLVGLVGFRRKFKK